jgi:hypothetical protein
MKKIQRAFSQKAVSYQPDMPKGMPLEWFG